MDLDEVIANALKIAEVAFRDALGIWELTDTSRQVVANMLACTLDQTMRGIDDPDDWWEEYHAYAIRHAGIIARVAISLARAGGRTVIEDDDLVEACDIVVQRAKRICPESLGNKTGCTGYARDAIMVR
jgi:hypothetical protein